MQKEGLLTRAAALEPALGKCRAFAARPAACDRHTQLRPDRRRGIGAAAGQARRRGFDVFLKCFERGVMVRQTGDTIAMAPPLVIEPKQIERIVETLGAVIRETGLIR